MLDAILVALAPFILNAITSLAKWLGGVQTTAGKRFLRAVFSLIGVVALSALNGTPVDPNSITSLVTAAVEALSAFLMAHGSYTLFWKPTTQAVPFGESAASEA